MNTSVFIILIILLAFILLKKKSINDMNIEKVYELQRESKSLYKEVSLNNLFKKYPKNNSGLKFGFICPGAIKTILFLKNNKPPSKLFNQIKILTDFQFFVEIYAIYREYLDKNVYLKMKQIIGNKSCKISNLITQEITSLFSKLPNNLKKNLPDDFYHIRHDTLICSKDKKLVKKRIQLLKGIYEGFDSSQCLGKRDGVSGCRDCCRNKYPENYENCVNLCMNY